MVAQLQAPDDWRRPGCDDRCIARRIIAVGLSGIELVPLHDPEAHEEYGLHIAGIEMGNAGLIETGLLQIDSRRCEVRVAGEFVNLTPNEWRILEHLARRLDRLCSHEEIVRSVWGEDWFSAVSPPGPWHPLRVNMARLRAKIRGAGWGIIATVTGRGYRLRYLPPGQAAPEKDPAAFTPTGKRIPPGQWAVEWSACRICGTTEHPHWARGFCKRPSCKRRYHEALARLQAGES